jgi:hypothetical protein
MSLIFVQLLNNEENGVIMNQSNNSRFINGLHGGRSQDRTVDLLLVRQAL